VKNFDPFQWIEKKELKKMGRFIQIALAGADFAVRSAAWKPEQSDLDEVGVYVSSGIGGFDIIEREHWKLVNGGPSRISPFFIPSAIVNLASGHISIRYGAKGPNSATATACSASAHAIGDSFKIIERGAAEMMICGGTEATITPMGVGGFASMKALSTRNDDPSHASRPFDAQRDGFVVGEGAGILVLESLEHAQKRGANILAEIVGYGMSGDAYHITQPAENGDGAYRVMKAAMKDAHLTPEDIGYVNAHGTSTPLGDTIETRALKRVFGERAKQVPISSTKSMTGHLLGGAGGLEAGIIVLALRDQILPPTINQETPDPECDLDYIPNVARKAHVEYALSNSFGFGGTNAALIFKRWAGN
jgi:3-oxoacyl-[acyl-carrier-protein] synthase II